MKKEEMREEMVDIVLLVEERAMICNIIRDLRNLMGILHARGHKVNSPEVVKARNIISRYNKRVGAINRKLVKA